MENNHDKELEFYLADPGSDGEHIKIKLSEESTLVCRYITDTLKRKYDTDADFDVMDTIDDILTNFIGILNKGYAGYPGLSGQRVDVSNVLDVYREQFSETMDLLKKYSPS